MRDVRERIICTWLLFAKWEGRSAINANVVVFAYYGHWRDWPNAQFGVTIIAIVTRIEQEEVIGYVHSNILLNEWNEFPMWPILKKQKKLARIICEMIMAWNSQ